MDPEIKAWVIILIAFMLFLALAICVPLLKTPEQMAIETCEKCLRGDFGSSDCSLICSKVKVNEE